MTTQELQLITEEVVRAAERLRMAVGAVTSASLAPGRDRDDAIASYDDARRDLSFYTSQLVPFDDVDRESRSRALGLPS